MGDERFERQIRFLVEMDKVKGIIRQTLLMDSSRLENDAEHSWHMALWAMVLAEYAASEVDVAKVMKMCLVHDVVEIDAGDTYCYDPAAQTGKKEREQRAAARIFGLLPAEQAAELKGLWEEFEAGQTPEARLAGTVDRIQAFANNYYSHGVSWMKHGVKLSQALKRIEPARAGAPRLYEFARGLAEEAARRGWLIKDA